LGWRRLEQAKGFEPSTPTLARFTSDRERDFRSDRPSANVVRIILARSNGVIVSCAPRFEPAKRGRDAPISYVRQAAGQYARR
jgi:hypothetical protein